MGPAEGNELNQDGGEQYPFEDLDSHYLRILLSRDGQADPEGTPACPTGNLGHASGV